jgi:hypothetical protein
MHICSCIQTPTHTSLHDMAKKPLSELILPEITLLEVAARLFAALREREAHPPHASSYTYWDAKTRDELVHPSLSIRYILTKLCIIGHSKYNLFEVCRQGKETALASCGSGHSR